MADDPNPYAAPHATSARTAEPRQGPVSLFALAQAQDTASRAIVISTIVTLMVGLLLRNPGNLMINIVGSCLALGAVLILQLHAARKLTHALAFDSSRAARARMSCALPLIGIGVLAVLYRRAVRELRQQDPVIAWYGVTRKDLDRLEQQDEQQAGAIARSP